MEGRSLLRGGILLFTLSVLRFGLDRVWVHEAVFPDAETELPRLLEESRDERDEQARRSAPLAPGESLDPNRSGEEELDRLPGIGPSTARALVADRDKGGGFSRAEDLLRVTGIGPATLAKIRPYLDFSKGVPLGLHRRRPGEVGTRIEGSRSAGAKLTDSSDSVPAAMTRIDLNLATSEKLQSLPGIGPALAKRILDSRLREGPFRTPDDLLRVRGIGPFTLARIRALVTPVG